MKKVEQKNNSDCGICCISMLTNIPYEKVREICFGNEKNKKDDSIRFEKLKDIFKKLRLSTKVYSVFDNPKKNGLLEIKYETQNGETFHYVAYDSEAGKIIDPQKNPPLDYVKLRYIEIQ